MISTEDISRWWSGRSFRRLLWSVPALLALLAWVIFALILFGWKTAEIETRYLKIARQAMFRRDFQTARIGWQRLLQMYSNQRSEYTFNMALTLFSLGRREEGADLMNLVAPLDKPGYAPAHKFVAQNLLSQTNLNVQMVKIAETHLMEVLSIQPDDADAHELLGKVYAQSGQYDLARQHLMQVVSARPDLTLILATVCKALGNESDARSWADRAVKFFSEKTSQGKLDEPAARLSWADSLVLLQDYPNAFRVLDEGFRQSGSQTYRPAMADICSFWALAVARETPTNVTARLHLVQQGLDLWPYNETLLRLLVGISIQTGEEGKVAQERITKMLAGEGGNTALLHLSLGVSAYSQKDMETAKRHFTLAFEKAPNMGVIANNLAAILSQGATNELDRALQISDSVCSQYPNVPNYRETHGQILFKLGRWKEAINDLEFALPKLPAKSKIHASLAESYRQLNMPDLAAEHARLARETAPAPAPKSGATNQPPSVKTTSTNAPASKQP